MSSTQVASPVRVTSPGVVASAVNRQTVATKCIIFLLHGP